MDLIPRSRLLVLLALGFVSSGCVAAQVGGPTTSAVVASPPTVSETITTSTTPSTVTTIRRVFNLFGKVVDPSGSAVSGATVTIGSAELTTGSDGSFTFEATEPEPFRVSKSGWTEAEVPWEQGSAFFLVTIEPKKVRGLRVGAGAAGDDAHFERLLKLAADTAVNAFVFDTKQEGGTVVYDTTIDEAHDIGAVVVWYDPVERLAQMRDQDLYAITRIVVFEDALRVKARPDEKLAGPWIDPMVETAWDYNIDLAIEACGLGFDEIQFDYVRYPAGRTARVSGQLSLTEADRVAAIEGFLAEARGVLTPMGCSTSAAIFAIVVSVPDDQGLGQKPEELSAQLDALSPMVYPSHYSDGWLGFDDPNDHPYAVTADAIDDALPRMAPGARLRPWLQAFWWTNSQIRASIQAAEDRDVGWILWNVRSNFDRAALPASDEVSE
ncbi:MAG: putative glycoside hydrolase [Acidimicrobiia bacterium]